MAYPVAFRDSRRPAPAGSVATAIGGGHAVPFPRRLDVPHLPGRRRWPFIKGICATFWVNWALSRVSWTALGRFRKTWQLGGAMSDVGVAVIVEDDADMRNLLAGVLMQAGFEVHTANDGRSGVELVRDRQPSVVTLDVGMPDIDGIEALRRIRQFSDAYILMLTGRTAESDVLTALQAGADDYVTKPFRPREIRARVAAMLRRPRPQHSVPAPAVTRPEISSAELQHDESVLRHNGLKLDHRMRTVDVGGVGLELTRSEFDLLHELLRSAGAVRSRRQLVETLRGGYGAGGGYISEADERAVEVHIGNLRRKLRDDPQSPRWLQTVRGVGYCLTRKRAGNA